MENKNLIRFAFTVGGFTLLSRILGMARDMLTAALFGTSMVMSAFVLAFRIPNLFRALFGEGALSSAFIPVFMESRRHDDEARAWQLARRVTTLVGGFLLLLIVLGIIAMTAALHLPGIAPKWAAALPLARIMLPYVFFICMAALAMAVLNSYRLFSVSAFTPALLNITWILSVLFIIPLFKGDTARIQALAWTVLVAGAVQLAYQLPSLWKVGWRPGVDTDWHDPRVKRVFMLMGPSALGLAVNQINVLISSILAFRIGDWAPSALFYAERLIYLPQGLLATSLATVLLPVLSDFAARHDNDAMREAVRHGLRTLLFVMTPAAIGLFALAFPVVGMLFERGAFNANSTALTARALSFYAPGLMAFCLAKVFVPAFYALKDTKTPVKIGLCSVTLCFTLNILFILTLPEYWKHAGLAAATVIAETFNGITLAVCLRRRLGPIGAGQILRGWLRALAAALVMAAAAYGLYHVLWTSLFVEGRLSLMLTRWIAVPASIGAGMLLYFGIARLFRFPELGFVLDALRSKKQPKPAAG